MSEMLMTRATASKGDRVGVYCCVLVPFVPLTWRSQKRGEIFQGACDPEF